MIVESMQIKMDRYIDTYTDIDIDTYTYTYTYL